MKVAAFIAGDKNIVKSSIVVFESLKKFEKDIDKYLFLSDINIDTNLIYILEKLDIKLMQVEDSIFKSSLTWPKECFLNFKVPNILYELGYNIALKLDNDILVNGKLDVEKNRPKNSIFSMINHNYDTMKDMIRNNWDFFERKYGIKDKNEKIGMFGNVYIDLKKYLEYNFWNEYRETYSEIITESSDSNGNSFFADMGLFAIVLKKLNLSYEVIEEKYNTCASVRHLSSIKNFDLNPRLIHYSGPKKPWKPLGIRILTNPYYAYLRQLWIEFVKNESEFKKDYEYLQKKINIIFFSKIYFLYIKFFLKLKKRGKIWKEK